MADVDMADAPTEKKKVIKAGDADSKGEKKRFEVKKVCASSYDSVCVDLGSQADSNGP
jgi:hypothetical protein